MKTIQPILKAFVCLLCLLSVKTGFAQNVGISTTSGFVPDASAALDVSYTNKGLLVPRVALTATNAAGPITSPATSLLVYNTATAGTSPNNVVPGYYYWNGTAWNMLITGTQATNYWKLTGNAGTSYLTNFLGTTDNNSLRFRTNNTQRFLLDSLGNAAVGLNPAFNTTNPEKLLVDAGTTSSSNVITGKGNINNYLQLNIQNNNAGTAASSDVVVTADDGNESNYYVDMGINSSANTANLYGGIHDAYLYNVGGSGTGGNFYIGTSTAAKSLGFLTGGSTIGTSTNNNNERMHIDGTTGNVGIANIAPTQKLDVTGTIVSTTTAYPNYAYNSANRIIFGEPNPPANETGSVVQFTSGSNTRNMLVGFGKTGVNASFLGNDGTQTMLGVEGTANPITFKTGLVYTATSIIASGVEVMRITNAGSVGIGTTAPSQKLDVNGSINASGGVIAAGSVTTDQLAGNTGTPTPGLQLGSTVSGETISSQRTAAGANRYGIDFYTGSINRMSITNTGNVGIGGNAPAYKLTVAGVVAPSADAAYTLGASNSRWTVIYATNGVIQTSDRRMKTNIKPLNYGLKEVLSMQPVSYNWQEKPTTEHKIGLIAQDVRKVVPEVVIGDETKEKLGMNYAELVPVLINAIKEQQKEIEDLKKAVQKLQK